MLNKKIIILVSCLTVMTVVSGCGKKEIKPVVEDDNEQKVVEKVDSSTKENNNEKILKLVGVDENDWNIYRSEKYRYTFNLPKKYKHTGNLVFNDETDEIENYTILFYCYINKLKEYDFNSRSEYIKWRCQKSNTYDYCTNAWDISVKEFDVFVVNGNTHIKIVELTGAGGITSGFYYIFKDKDVYLFKLRDYLDLDMMRKAINDIEDIVKTMEFIE